MQNLILADRDIHRASFEQDPSLDGRSRRDALVFGYCT